MGTKANMDDCFHLLSGDCSKAMSYGVLVRPLESSSSYSHESKKEVKVFIGKTEFTMKPEGEDVAVKVNGSPIRMMTEKKTIKGVAGHIDAKISMSKDKVVILESSKISVFFDGKRVKVEGSNLLKNKLCGLCGDNNKKIGDVPSPRQCLLSKPKLEVASYRVSLPSKQCSPLPGHLRAELERETARCIRFSHKPTGGISSAYRQSESLYSSGECTKTHHEIVDKYAKNELCFSVIPIVECGSSCHSSATKLRMNVGFTCMSKSDHRTQRIAEKIRNGEVITHELMHFPISYTTAREMPLECKPNTMNSGGYSSGYGNSLY